MNTRSNTYGFICCAAAMLTLGASMPLTQRLIHFPPAAGKALRYALAAALLTPLACWAMRGWGGTPTAR